MAAKPSIRQFLVQRRVAGTHQVDQGILKHQAPLTFGLDDVDHQAAAEQIVGIQRKTHPIPVGIAKAAGIVHHLGHQIAFADIPGFVTVHPLNHPEQDLRVLEQQPGGIQGAEAFTHPPAPAGCSGSDRPIGSGIRRW